MTDLLYAFLLTINVIIYIMLWKNMVDGIGKSTTSAKAVCTIFFFGEKVGKNVWRMVIREMENLENNLLSLSWYIEKYSGTFQSPSTTQLLSLAFPFSSTTLIFS